MVNRRIFLLKFVKMIHMMKQVTSTKIYKENNLEVGVMKKIPRALLGFFMVVSLASRCKLFYEIFIKKNHLFILFKWISFLFVKREGSLFIPSSQFFLKNTLTKKN